jgi:hypothetical protein
LRFARLIVFRHTAITKSAKMNRLNKPQRQPSDRKANKRSL